MRTHYSMMPTQYIEELQASGKRMKARCFMEYFLDVQAGAVNSFGFYAKSWGEKSKPMSKGTVHKWVKEFVYEIERFFNAHSLKNQQHYSSVKNQSERRVNGERTKDPTQSPILPNVSEVKETLSERLVNQALNIYDDGADTRMKRRLFDDLYMIYRANTKNAGKKEEAWEEYRKIDGISHRQLVRAIVLYLHDGEVTKRFNLKNFLMNQIYLSYLSKKIRVKVGEEWIIGEYDDESAVLTADDGRQFRLEPERLAELLACGELEFVLGDAA